MTYLFESCILTFIQLYFRTIFAFWNFQVINCFQNHQEPYPAFHQLIIIEGLIHLNHHILQKHFIYSLIFPQEFLVISIQCTLSVLDLYCLQLFSCFLFSFSFFCLIKPNSWSFWQRNRLTFLHTHLILHRSLMRLRFIWIHQLFNLDSYRYHRYQLAFQV